MDEILGLIDGLIDGLFDRSNVLGQLIEHCLDAWIHRTTRSALFPDTRGSACTTALSGMAENRVDSIDGHPIAFFAC